MLRYMLDTNICIYVIKNRPKGLRERFNSLADQLCISAVTLAEMIYGAEKSARPVENLVVVEQFAARLDVLPFAEKAAAHYGQLRAELDRAGHPVGPYDMMIGGHARSVPGPQAGVAPFAAQSLGVWPTRTVPVAYHRWPQ